MILDNQPLFLAAGSCQAGARSLERLLSEDLAARRAARAAAARAHPTGVLFPAGHTTPAPGLHHLDISGLILKGAGGSEPGWWFDLDDLHATCDIAVADALADPGQPATLLLRIESGGGYITGLPEAARAIARVRAAGVQVISYTETLCGSAALWLGCCADIVAAAPSANYGSVGAYTFIDDLTGLLAAAGVERHVFRSGTFKAMGLPGKEVTEEEKAHLRQGVADSSAQFFAHVAAHRPGVPAEVFETAAVYTGEEAVGKNLVDILEDTESRLLKALALAL